MFIRGDIKASRARGFLPTKIEPAGEVGEKNAHFQISCTAIPNCGHTQIEVNLASQPVLAKRIKVLVLSQTDQGFGALQTGRASTGAALNLCTSRRSGLTVQRALCTSRRLGLTVQRVWWWRGSGQRDGPQKLVPNSFKCRSAPKVGTQYIYILNGPKKVGPNICIA